jgi:hypothetical protein
MNFGHLRRSFFSVELRISIAIARENENQFYLKETNQNEHSDTGTCS